MTTPSALLLIDLQHALFDATPRPHEAAAVLDRVNALAERARSAGVPVLWMQHETQPGHRLAHGSPGWALADGLHTADGDVFFRKTTPDSFLRTGLADWLAARGIGHLVIAGYASEFCIDTSTRRAAGLGLAVTLAADAHTTHDKPYASGALIRAHHNATLADLTSFGVPINALPAAGIGFAPATVPAAPHAVADTARLATLYGQPSEAALVKETDHLTDAYLALLQASPFLVLATTGPQGLDASPRGDPAPALVVQDRRTLLLADRRGNHRLDSLRNIVADPRVALLCLVPGTSETLRIRGRARLSTDPALLQRLAMDGRPPATVLVLQIERVYFQCARALMRSGLWQPATWPARSSLPSAGSMLNQATQGRFDGAAYDAALPARQQASLY
ncbi:MAG: MSMEG_1061 family FMN-dependent PPOX-type flavoprotein [Pseudomonadota bacterium]